MISGIADGDDLFNDKEKVPSVCVIILFLIP